MLGRDTVHLGKPLKERAQAAAAKAGYSSLEEFVKHAVEKELGRLEEAAAKEEVMKQLRGLGYLE